ncbi:tryptophan 7-halogenase [Sphingomonas daechungensis]|uniref:Tryptophan 7-halogenase n=1 Tax=Sphingomonas daechungensis TaxID=1176646 RepID=A0ABX6T260_9SPHN|nr:tryptophan halogenase family protein [Sphingomonas daechungensis]QNP43576.1 tryptophan 7-halogenase [Sphingomonas daechungensis]
MDGQKIKRIVIAGGGTAGWIAAYALVNQLGGLLDITLVESDEIGTVGVGESTIPTARTFHEYMGIDEADFVRATGSTFKLGISFEDWAREGDRYIHSFGAIGRSTWMVDFHHFWLRAHELGIAQDIGPYCLEHEAAAQGRFAASGNVPLNYAYHLDAGLYGRYLRGLAEAAGVRRVEGKIGEVRQNGETGDIEALVLEDGQVVEGDLFIDCTGFRALLIDKALGCKFEDWSKWLPTDSALAVQTRQVESPRPYTRAMAHEAGWRWKIPLQHRVGNGLVYSSAHMSDERARELLNEKLEGDVLIEPRLIRFKAGQRPQVWVKNCIALGLSSGFIEPLESTSIHLIMIAVTRLLQVFPSRGVSPAISERFNEQANREIEAIRDFIVLHYHLNEREGSDFWRDCRDLDIPDTLKQRIALFRDAAHVYQDTHDLFRIDSWVQVMLGQRLQPLSYHPAARLMPETQMKEALANLQGNIARAVASLPAHEDALRSFASPAG